LSSDIHESQFLDFKGNRGALKQKGDDIAFDMAAFANAGGGTLLYGIAQTGEKSALTSQPLHGGDYAHVKPEWFHRLASGKLDPPLFNLEVCVIGAPDVGRFIAVNVSQSVTAHQALSQKHRGVFPHRVNDENLPMPRHAILDVLRRGSVPSLVIWAVNCLRSDGKEWLRFGLANVSTVPCNHWTLTANFGSKLTTYRSSDRPGSILPEEAWLLETKELPERSMVDFRLAAEYSEKIRKTLIVAELPIVFENLRASPRHFALRELRNFSLPACVKINLENGHLYD
jgi:hypothetical protein